MLEFNAFNARLKGIALHLAECFPSTAGRSLEFVPLKKFGRELGNDYHDNKWTARWIYFIFYSAKSQRRHFFSFRAKYVVCSPTKVVLCLIELLPLTVSLSFPSLARRKISTKNLTSPTPAHWINWLSSLYFSIGKTTRDSLMHSFRVWYVQCLSKRPVLNLIGCDWIRPIESLTVILFSCSDWKFSDEERLQNPAAFDLKLLSGKSNFRSRR